MTAMPKDLFNRDGAIFMGARRDPAGCQVGLFGVPYDGTTSFRPGTRFGPAAIRQVSDGLETYDTQLDADLEDIAYADLGAVEISFGAPCRVVMTCSVHRGPGRRWRLWPNSIQGAAANGGPRTVPYKG